MITFKMCDVPEWKAVVAYADVDAPTFLKDNVGVDYSNLAP